MKITIICIGTEILIGDIFNSNLAFAGKKMEALGYNISKEICIPDIKEDITQVFSQTFKKNNIVITIGGLGPTSDDITKETISNVLGVPSILDQTTYQNIINYFSRRKDVVIDDELVKKQATIPQGAEVLKNNNGTAPGIWYQSDNRILVMLPGPPSEFCPLFTEAVMPKIMAETPPQYKRFKAVIFNMPEPVIAREVNKILENYNGVNSEFCANPGYVKLRLVTAFDKSEIGKKAFADCADFFGEAFIEGESPDLVPIIGNILRRNNYKLATAESCTGGLIASKITDYSGVSDFFAGSVVTYSNQWKQNLLGIDPEIIKKHGAVSHETAEAMLNGLKNKLSVEAGIAVTGIAGPTGGTPQKPLGLVYIGTFVDNTIKITKHFFRGKRQNIREKTVASAINQLYFQML